MTKTPGLKDAYALQSHDDVRDLYRDWAETYDESFGDNQGYQAPREVAETFTQLGGMGPVLDVGAGTGLVGQYLSTHGSYEIDGVDLSADMLSVAKRKGHYRNLIEADITKPLPGNRRYKGVISAGTFTFGHVGPEGIVALLNAASTAAQFVISVNLKHFSSAGFAKMLDDIDGQITDVQLKDFRMYDARADVEHRDDRGRLIMFKTL